MTTANKHIISIIAVLVISFIPHILFLPIWISGWCLIAWLAALLLLRFTSAQPTNKTLQLLALCGLIGLLLSFGLHISSNHSIGLLVIMAGLKPLEIRSYRDKMVCVFLAYFIVFTTLLFSDSLAATFHMVFSVICSTAVLIQLNSPSIDIKSCLRLSSLMIIKSVPLMLLLFFFFPRLQSNVWRLPKQSKSIIGFTETIDLKTFSNLASSNKIVFRVEFDQNPPARELLYWRGIVFHHFNGTSWTTSPHTPFRYKKINGQDDITYRINQEPTNSKFLFALDLPTWASSKALPMADHTLRAKFPLSKRTSYNVTSSTKYQTGPLTEEDKTVLQLPVTGNYQARALASQWRKETASSLLIAEKGLNFFRQNNFTYTLNPETLPKDAIDHFLFQSQKGYCGHYAAAFTFLMRAANIPARIIGGYLGGEETPFGDYLIIKQSDAHAWSELWIEGEGWIRFDPTLIVVPQRVRQGLSAALPQEERPLLYSLPLLNTTLGKLRLGWEAINTNWLQWVIGYSYWRQHEFAAKIKLWKKSLKKRSTILLYGVGLSAPLLILCLLLRTKKSLSNQDHIQRIYGNFCTKLARIGLPRGVAQGPVDYGRMVALSRPELEKEVQSIIDLYIRLRYQSQVDSNSLSRLQLLIQRFKPRRLSEN